MSQSVEIEYLDGKFTVQENEPTLLSEMLPILGTEEAVITEVADNLRYRNKYPRVYRKVSAELESKHSWPRIVIKEETKKDNTVKKTHESVNDHIRAALVGRKAVDGGAAAVDPLPDAQTILTELFTSIGQSEPLYIKGERTGGGGKVSEAALQAANAFFAEGDAKVESVATYIESMVPGYKVGRDADGNATPDSLARAISALQKKAEKDAAAKAKADLGALIPA